MDVVHIPGLLTSIECAFYRDMIDMEIQNEKVWLRPDVDTLNNPITSFLANILAKRGILYNIVGNVVTVGRYTKGESLQKHADHPYQGDSTHVLLIYLNTLDNNNTNGVTCGDCGDCGDCSDCGDCGDCSCCGGETLFYKHMTDINVETSVSPLEGKAIIFGIYKPHEASTVLHGHKYILGCELSKF